MRFMNGMQVTPKTSSHLPFKDTRRNFKSNADVLKRMIIALLSYFCFGVSISRYRFGSSIRHFKGTSIRLVQVAAFSTPFSLHNSKRGPVDPARQRCRFDSASLFVINRIIPTYLSSSRNNDVGGYDPSEGIEVSERIKEKSNVGNPQIQVREKEFSVTSILKELAAIQQQGPQKYCILGTRHCSYLHQQIIELLAYALVLSGNHVYTSGSSGTNAATIRGALRAERPELLTVVLPQSLTKQTEESQQLLKQVKDVVEMPQNNDLSLDIASRICNSYLLSLTDQLISFAFHESTTVIEASKEAKKLDKLVTVLFLD